MSKHFELLIAGFGGQGILFTGKFIVYAGMLQGREVSWLPSYGPEMRGGTANCNVIISDDSIGSPIVTHPTDLIVMNGPSLDRFEDIVVPGGRIFIDSTLIQRKVKRTDVEAYYIPATQMAIDAGMQKMANMIMLGKFIKEVDFCSGDMIDTVLHKNIPPKKANLFDINRRAIDMGLAN